jgi:hypothetical protein
MEGEISYDLAMDDNMSFVEGTYRIDSGDWRVFIFSKRAIAQPIWNESTWASGVSGLVFHVPATMSLNTLIVERLMSEALSVSEWQRLSGPDSMTLR